MSTGALVTTNTNREYTDFTIMSFPNWRTLSSTSIKIGDISQSQLVIDANQNFRNFIVRELITDKNKYGLFGKEPRSFDDAIKRDKFLYYEEYREIKKSVSAQVMTALNKKSEAEIMKPKFVYNDRELGEFVYSKAEMSLVPEIKYYSVKHKRVADFNAEVGQDGDILFLKKDKSEVIKVFEVTLFDSDGNDILDENNEPKKEYIEIKGDGEQSLVEASEKGVLSVTSTNKKVYLYKEKKPKTFKAIKLIVGLCAGGWDKWENDFYTGVTTAIMFEILESLGYSVEIVCYLGGGRCDSCGAFLNFDGQLKRGRRFFSFIAKPFNEQCDMDGLLYTLCDPSFHSIKWVTYINYWFGYFGDQFGDNRDNGNPFQRWHGIKEEDMQHPIGSFEKNLDLKKGNNELLYYFIHMISKDEISSSILNIVAQAENINREALLNAGLYKDLDLKEFQKNN